MLFVFLNVPNTVFQNVGIFLCSHLRMILLSCWTGDRVTDHSEYKPLYLMTEVSTDQD